MGIEGLKYQKNLLNIPLINYTASSLSTPFYAFNAPSLQNQAPKRFNSKTTTTNRMYV